MVLIKLTSYVQQALPDLLLQATEVFIQCFSPIATGFDHRGSLSLDKDYSDGARFVIEFRLPNNSK